MDPREGSIEAGEEAIIRFYVEPTETNLSEALLKKLPYESDHEEAIRPLAPLPVSTEIYRADVEKGEIIFPEVAVEHAGTYILSCDGNFSEMFNLEVVMPGMQNNFSLLLLEKSSRNRGIACIIFSPW